MALLRNEAAHIEQKNICQIELMCMCVCICDVGLLVKRTPYFTRKIRLWCMIIAFLGVLCEHEMGKMCKLEQAKSNELLIQYKTTHLHRRRER